MHPDAWSNLKSRTPARIALGRAGGSLPTAERLAFAADHADARDAVHAELDIPAFEKSLAIPVLSLHSQATDRTQYLKRPDLGRRLDAASVKFLQSHTAQADVALIVADGLSSTAAQLHAAHLLHLLLPLIKFSIAPICVVKQARVAIEDEIGSLLGVKIAVILIGERPGLGLVDSLGAYLVHNPTIGKTDADRNCVSNIHPNHLTLSAAAQTLAWLIDQSFVRQLSGLGLKDERALHVSLHREANTGRFARE